MDEDIIMKFALEKPAFRILVNTVGALGAVGYTNELLPSLTLGPGTFGGSIISENVSAKHLFNVKRLAFETRPVNPSGSSDYKVRQNENESKQKLTESISRKPEIKPAISHNIPPQIPKPAQQKSWLDEIDERIRLKATHFSPATKSSGKVQEEEKTDKILGTGISEEEVERIIREFSKK